MTVLKIIATLLGFTLLAIGLGALMLWCDTRREK